MEKKWLAWAKQLQSIAQAGLTYSTNKYDRERFEQIREMSVDILNNYTDAGEEKIRDLFCFETGYQTPKVDVRGAIFRQDTILLVKESIDGCWSMPGGWADIGLSVKENIEKEAREEAGLHVVAKNWSAYSTGQKMLICPILLPFTKPLCCVMSLMVHSRRISRLKMLGILI